MYHELHLDSVDFPSEVAARVGNIKKIYLKGDLDALKGKYIAVIGSRRMTAYGRAVVESFVPKFVREGFGVVSGLADGVDSYAHSVCIKAGGNTIGVLGFGTKFLKYDSQLDLAQEIAKRPGSCLISQFDPYQKPAKFTFIKRNHTIACLASFVVVIESTEKSGTNYTVNSALELGKDVYAIPGSIFSLNSVGNHNLLRAGALLLANYKDIKFRHK